MAFDYSKFVYGNLHKCKELHITQDLTAREVAKRLGIPYSTRLNKALNYHLGNKGYGWGGKRKGSGNKKGVSLNKTAKKVEK